MTSSRFASALSKPFQNVRAFFGAGQIVFTAPPHDHLAVLDEDLQHALQRQHARLAVDQRQVDDAEGRLHGRVLIQQAQDRFGIGRRCGSVR